MTDRQLDAGALTDDIVQIAAVIDTSLDAGRLDELLGFARPGLRRELPAQAFIQLALLADCLRIVQTTTAADGNISDDEILFVLPLLAAVGDRFGKALHQFDGTLVGRSPRLARRFLEGYAGNDEPFGHRHAASEWIGLELCRQTALAGDRDALDSYERMAMLLFDDIARIDGLSDAANQARLDLRAVLAERATLDAEPEPDRRLRSFLSGRTAVFSSVALAHLMSERDPFDVEDVHTEARESFLRLVERATIHHGDGQGRMLLVLGESGSGKTHLLRALRAQLHGQRLGYAAYIQLHSRSEDYLRYVASALVDALDQPYDQPDDLRSGLLLLSNSLVDRLAGIAPGDVDRLRAEGGEAEESMTDVVNRLVDHLLLDDGLGPVEPDVLRALLLLQRLDPRVSRRVIQFLRCEDMNDHDRRYLADVTPRRDADAPLRMIIQLGRLSWVLQGRALALLVDQVEDQSYGPDGHLSFLRAVDTLRRVTDEVPSAIAVLACLDDLYQTVKPQVAAAARDRLEHDPPPLTLRSARTSEEIHAITARRLDHLYEQTGARFRPEDPIYPIRSETLKRLENRRLRDVLDFLNRFRERCVMEQRLVEDEGLEPGSGTDDPALAELDRAWNDERIKTPDVPVDGPPLLELIEAAVRFVGQELETTQVTVAGRDDGLHVAIDERELFVGLANKAPAGGGFGRQVGAVRASAGTRVPVVVRTSEFPTGKASRQVVSDLRKAGGRSEVIRSSDLRAVIAVRTLLEVYGQPAVRTWLTARQPVGSLAGVRALLDLDRVQDALDARRAESTAAPAPGPEPEPGTTTGPDPIPSPAVVAPPAPIPASAPTGAGGAAASQEPRGPLDLGTVDSLGGGPCELPLDLLRRHSAVLGASGSGKTTAALRLIEQVLERGIPVVLVDRKGDLAGYARPDWWEEQAGEPADTARKRSLGPRVEVRLFTPGSSAGRPLSLSAVPALADVPDHERSTLIKYAAGGLADLARLSPSSPLPSILSVAVRLMATTGRSTSLDELVELIHGRDDALVAEVPRFEDKHFKKLAEQLETVRVANDDFFDAGGEQLSADVLLTPGASGKVPLSIVNTQFLGDHARSQLWISRLIGELSRHAARHPSATLQALVMFDEADVYLPAGAAKPPTKEPMMDLLRRARSGGIGVMLATQSPGDFDYKSRDLITTWLVGKIGDDRSIGKMRPLFEGQGGTIAAKLPKLGQGRFFLMSGPSVQAVRVTGSLLRTEQLGTNEILDLAARTRS